MQYKVLAVYDTHAQENVLVHSLLPTAVQLLLCILNIFHFKLKKSIHGKCKLAN